MSDQVLECDVLSVTVTGAFRKHTIMMLNTTTGKWVAYDGAAANGKLALGALTTPTHKTGDNDAAIRLFASPGVHVAYASGAMSLGDEVKGVTGGEASNTGTGKTVGTCIEAAGVGEYFRYLPV